MAVDLIIRSSNAGVWSPHLDGRSDLEKYYSACRILDNMIPLPYGDAERRPGTYFVAEIKDNSKKARLIPFQFSTEQAYIIEAGDQYMRFYKDRGQIITGTGTEDLSGIGSIVAHYLLNDNLATTAVLDDDGTTHNGVATANTSVLNVTGKVGTGAFDFDGVNAVEIDDHADFTFVTAGADDPFSLQAWVYVTHTGVVQMILAKWKVATAREWALWLTAANKFSFSVYDETNNKAINLTTDDAIGEGWHLVIATYDGVEAYTGMTIYVDGAAVDATGSTDAGYASIVDQTTKVTIGAHYNSSGALVNYWADKIDNVAIFSKELSATEVASLYSTGAYEISSSYLEADLFGLQRVQSADVLYNVHSDYPPSKLTRYAHDDWQLSDIVFDWPAFLDENDTDITITPTNGSAPLAVGTSVTLTASSAIFTSNHIGSYWLIKHPRTDSGANGNSQSGTIAASDTNGTTLTKVEGDWRVRILGDYSGKFVIERSYDNSNWHTLETFNPTGSQTYNITGEENGTDAYYRVATRTRTSGTLRYTISVDRYYHYGIVKITAFTEAKEATAEIIRELQSEAATKLWSEGAWSDEKGHPVSVAFYEGRLWFAGTTYRPLDIWGSKVRSYENMRSGTLADDAVKFTIDATMQNMIRWLVGQDVLLIGTAGAEWKLGSADPSDAITPSNPIKPRIQTTYGSKEIQAILLANAILFVGAQGRKVRGAQYVFEKGEVGGYDAPDYTIFAEHITESGIVGMAYQQNPYPILWAWLDNGKMIGMVFEPGQKVWGWFPLVIDGLVESVAVINGVTEDEIWIIVKRTIDGSTKRYIEYFKPRDWGIDQADCFFVDSGLTFDGGVAVDISSITKANPTVVTVDTWPTDGDGDNIADGDQIKLLGVAGMTEVNNKVYTVSNPSVGNKTFELRDKLDEVDINSTGFTTYISGGTVRKVENSFSGLGHLEGKTVSVLGDGSVHTDVVVGSGAITLTDYFNKVHVGLPFISKSQPMKLEIPGGGTIKGKKKRIPEIVFSFFETLGANFGTTAGTDTIPFRKTTDPMGSPPPLFTGEKIQTFPGGFELSGDIYVEQTQPLPMTVRSIIARLELYG